MKTYLLAIAIVLAGAPAMMAQGRYHRNDHYERYDRYRDYDRYRPQDHDRYDHDQQRCEEQHQDYRYERRRPMDEAAFHTIVTFLEDESFDSNRLMAARRAVRAGSMTSMQVLYIMKTFDFESNRLEFAKYTYAYVYDPELYFLVEQGFDFSFSADELEAFMDNNQR